VQTIKEWAASKDETNSMASTKKTPPVSGGAERPFDINYL
jgi:hypothetical protein